MNEVGSSRSSVVAIVMLDAPSCQSCGDGVCDLKGAMYASDSWVTDRGLEPRRTGVVDALCRICKVLLTDEPLSPPSAGILNPGEIRVLGFERGGDGNWESHENSPLLPSAMPDAFKGVETCFNIRVDRPDS